MSFFDDLVGGVSESGSQIGSSVGGFLNDLFTVKAQQYINKAQGNPLPGQTGSTAGIPVSNQPTDWAKNAGEMSTSFMKYLPWIVGIPIAGYVGLKLLKKGRRS